MLFGLVDRFSEDAWQGWRRDAIRSAIIILLQPLQCTDSYASVPDLKWREPESRDGFESMKVILGSVIILLLF
jgi:hypothetical protein